MRILRVLAALGGLLVRVLRVLEALGGSFVRVLRVWEAPGVPDFNDAKPPGGSAKENKHTRIGGPRLGAWGGWK